MTGTKNSKSNMAVVIVGGGPSGAAAAKAMADRGYTNINLYEAYPHPKSLSKTSSKAYVIALSYRGQQGILDSTGIDMVKEAEGAAEGVISNDMARHIHNPKTKQTSAKTRNHKETPSLIIPRKALTERLLDAAHESGTCVNYQHRLVEVDFENRVATFAILGENGDEGVKEKATPRTVNVKYDLLIGADGCNSKVRNLMVDNNKSLKDFSARIEEDTMEYQVAVLPDSLFVDSHPEGTVHSWNNKELNAICLGFPMKKNDGGTNDSDTPRYSMLFAVVFPEGKLESFRDDGYRAPLTKLLPDLFVGEDGKKRLSEFEGQLRENHIANGGLCVWSSSLGHADVDAQGQTGGVILLGDSGHGMWPSLGQGANCALESVAVFVRCLDELANKDEEKGEIASSWTKELVQRFQDARFEDAVAAVDLTYGGIGARKSRGRINAPFSYKLQMIGMMLLHKLTFGIVPMPALLRLMTGSKDLSYSTAKRFNFHYEKYICLGALFFSIGIITAGMKAFPNSSGNGTEL